MRVWSLALVVVLLAALATPSPAPLGLKKGKGLKALKGIVKVGLALGALGAGGGALGNLRGLATVGKILAVGGVGLGALALKGGNNNKRRPVKTYIKPAKIYKSVGHRPATITYHKPAVYHKPATYSYHKRPATYARSYGKATSYGGYYRG